MFAKMHVSDSAAQHFRVALLDLRLCGDERAHGNAAKDGEDRGALPSPLLEEMAFSRDLIQRFPGHDALWGALRSLMRSWIRFGSRGEGGDSSQSSGSPVGEVGEGGTSLAEELCAWGEALGSGVQGESTNSGLRESAGSVEAGRGQQRESSEEGRVASILRFARSRFQDRSATMASLLATVACMPRQNRGQSRTGRELCRTGELELSEARGAAAGLLRIVTRRGRTRCDLQHGCCIAIPLHTGT